MAHSAATRFKWSTPPTRAPKKAGASRWSLHSALARGSSLRGSCPPKLEINRECIAETVAFAYHLAPGDDGLRSEDAQAPGRVRRGRPSPLWHQRLRRAAQASQARPPI